MRVLVTNDDGLHAPGLAHLASAAVAAGHDVFAVAPEGNRSGSGASLGDLGEHASLRCRDMPLPGLDGVRSTELDAPPALCVIAACLGAFGDPPELVLSGINPGLNTGRSTLHSGTVGAALTAANFGLPAVAVSIDGHEPSVQNWPVAAEMAIVAAAWALQQPGVTTLNVSVPDRPGHELLEPRFATLASMGVIHTEVLGRDAERLELGFRLTEAASAEGSDSQLAAAGHVVISAITGIGTVELPNTGSLTAELAESLGRPAPG